MGQINNLVFKGIENGKNSFCGPHIAQIDLTGKCNANCIGCWVHSPLIDNPTRDKNKVLSLDKVKNILKDLSRLKTKKIFLSGSGEPLLHPDILEIITLIKKEGFELNLITNGLLLDKKKIELMVRLGVDMITASIWAGSPQTYTKTHPSKNREDFYRIKDNLKYFYKIKTYNNKFNPRIKIYNTICSLNYHEIEEMVEFSLDVGAEIVEFQLMDIINEKMSFLSLSNKQIHSIKEQFDELNQYDRAYFREMAFSDLAFSHKELKEFPRRFIKAPKDFSIIEKSGKKDGLPMGERTLVCPKGYQTLPTETNPLIDEENNKISFKLSPAICKKCEKYAKGCPVDSDYILILNLLRIYGFGSFIRRISSAGLYNQSYDKSVIDGMPCYMGWYYSRILSTGEVIPCCKAAGLPLGNINKQSFNQVWSSKKYQEFRYKAKNLSKSDKYFSNIDCFKGCDNWGMNIKVHKEYEKYYIDKDREGLAGKSKNQSSCIVIKAADFVKGDFNRGTHDFGKSLVIDGGQEKGYAEYLLRSDRKSKYELWSRYASAEYRPVDILIDGNLVKKAALNRFTGGWTREYLRWVYECEVELSKGIHKLVLKSFQCIPHIEKVGFFKKKNSLPFLKKEIKSNYFKVLNEYFVRKGLDKTIKKIFYNLAFHRVKDKYLNILGIYDGCYGYKGPFHVQIDLTNNCNNNCIVCWCNSPLFKKSRLSLEEKKEYLPLSLAKELIDEIWRLGATEVYFSGSGEPFMHPHIIEVLEYAKSKKLVTHVNTNFTLVNKERLDKLIAIGVDFLTVSTWAGTAETYDKTHPNKNKEDFYRIKENLIYLNKQKKKKPFIKLYNVLFNMNYFEMQEMIDFAVETKSESVEFTLADTISGVTDALALNNSEFHELSRIGNDIKLRLTKDNKVKGVLLFQFDQFLRRISVLENVKDAKYDRDIIDSMPCYIGWLFARIIPNGQVHSCLKAHRIPTGSLYTKRFFEIWNSNKQKFFRKKTLVYKKCDPFFRLIGNDPDTKEAGCYKSCDDIGRNTWMHRRISMLTFPEKLILKLIAQLMKAGRRIKPKQEEYRMYHKDKRIAGILHGRKTFTGPEQVVVDLTNRCNLRCLPCWLYSSLLTKDKPSDELLNQELSKDVAFSFIDDIARLGCKRIRFTGGGEPLMHRDFMEIVEYSRSKGLLVSLTTNFGLTNRGKIDHLLKFGLEELCISIWASNNDVYQKTHPGVSGNYFDDLKHNLRYLQRVKRGKPRVTFANVLMNENFRDIESMYDFGRDYGADALYFTIVDVIKGQTDKLLLNNQETHQLYEMAKKIKSRNNNCRMELEFFDGFLRRLDQPLKGVNEGFYDRDSVNKIPCYVGWIFCRVLANGAVAPCCRGVNKIMGNLNSASFEDIWFSEKYNEFRSRAKYQRKDTLYFKSIGCMKECDNLMHNIVKHRELSNEI